MDITVRRGSHWMSVTGGLPHGQTGAESMTGLQDWTRVLWSGLVQDETRPASHRGRRVVAGVAQRLLIRSAPDA